MWNVSLFFVLEIKSSEPNAIKERDEDDGSFDVILDFERKIICALLAIVKASKSCTDIFYRSFHFTSHSCIICDRGS